MPRIRSIKPEFFRHRRLFVAERDTGLPLRLAFAGLWTCCDRDGRFKWEPDELKLDCLPYDDLDFSRVLDALTTRGFVVRYASRGREYGYVPGFSRHQVINNREGDSILPPPPPESDDEEQKPAENLSSPEDDAPNLTRAPRVDDACPTPLKHAQAEGKGMEGNGEGAPTNVGAARATRVPDISEILTWIEEGCAARQRHGLPELDLRLEAERFWNYWQAKPGAAGRKLSWSGTWINWALRSEPPKGTGNGRRDTSGANAIAAGFANALAKRSADRGGDYDAAEPLRLVRPASGSA